MCFTTQLLVADIAIDGRSPKPRLIPPRRKLWKLRDQTVRKNYENFVNDKCKELLNQEPRILMTPGTK